jgi:hypothetical protein
MKLLRFIGWFVAGGVWGLVSRRGKMYLNPPLGRHLRAQARRMLRGRATPNENKTFSPGVVRRARSPKMAKPIRATPPVTGETARVIQKELREGTPNTPERVETIRRADEVFRRSVGRSAALSNNR